MVGPCPFVHAGHCTLCLDCDDVYTSVTQCNTYAAKCARVSAWRLARIKYGVGGWSLRLQTLVAAQLLYIYNIYVSKGSIQKKKKKKRGKNLQ